MSSEEAAGNFSATSPATLKNDITLSDLALPKHLAIIMDGNGRWAKAQNLDRLEGHKAGARTVRMVVEESRRLGIRYLTLYAFSSENWGRPQNEISGLMTLLAQNLLTEKSTLFENGIRLRAVGNLDKLPKEVSQVLQNVINATEQHTGMDLILALSYGGRDEIVEATKKIATAVKSGYLDISEINAEVFSRHLYTADIPDPDLLIRTSNEFRISNFLLWQIAYSELIFTETPWPAFSSEHFHDCLQQYSGRRRRFGLTDDQIKSVS